MIDDKRIEAIYAEIDRYIIATDMSEARALGPTYLADQMATCRNYLNFVSLLFTELSRAKWEVGSELRVAQDTYKLEYDERLATDEHIKRLANIEDRKSTVAYGLRLKEKEINRLKAVQSSIEQALKVVVHRSRELHSTMDILKEQRRLMDSETKTGAFYGDERTGRAKKGKLEHSEPQGPMKVDDDITGDELDAILSNEAALEAKQADPTPETPVDAVPAPVEPPTTIAVEKPAEALVVPAEVPLQQPPIVQDEEAIIRAFLDSGDGPKAPSPASKSSEEEDFSALLDNL